MAICVSKCKLSDLDVTNLVGAATVSAAAPTKNGHQRRRHNEIPSTVCLLETRTHYRVPFGLAVHLYTPTVEAAELEIGGAPSPHLTTASSFTGSLKPNQQTAVDSVCRCLETARSTILAAEPGFGKTISSIYIACRFKLPTLIVVNKLVLVKQWRDAVRQFTDKPASVRYITPPPPPPSSASPSPKKGSKNGKEAVECAAEDSSSAQFFIVNAINISKYPLRFWKRMKFLIVDELHQIISRVLLLNLLMIKPLYVLGLSATPYRFDEFNDAIPMFFGQTKYGRELNVRFHVQIYSTRFVPETLLYTAQNRLDWNHVLTCQMRDRARNELMVNVIAKFNHLSWLILIKRVEHATLLVDLFRPKGIRCATLVGSQQEFDKSCNVLIGTIGKIGVGFDHVALNALCIAADVRNYLVQFLGRCMRNHQKSTTTTASVPLVLDFRDALPILSSHLDSRISDYRKHGGVVKEVRGPQTQEEEEKNDM